MVLTEIDILSITLLTDNYTDRLLPTVYPSIRPPLIKNEQFLPLPAPIAEHGFSTIIRAVCFDKNSSIDKENIVLFDCGTSKNGVIHNADILGLDFNSIHSIVLSHGHFDHFTGLVPILERINKPMRMICHPDVFLKRRIIFPNGKDKARLPFLNIQELTQQKLNIVIKKDPSILSMDSIEEYKNELDYETHNSIPRLLITGQIPRHTTYEKGFPLQYKEDPINGNLVHDPLVKDDQAIIANVKN
jgi:7,8-dihydropterin-6-yl-methyl-4-(beta-D-ribofuranosyl)aminobenzene 5'-phosphate synthase